MMHSFPIPLLFISLSTIIFQINSYPSTVNTNLDSLPPSQINRLCSYISNIETTKNQSPEKRFAVPFPDMHRFLSTSHRLHHHDGSIRGGSEIGTKKDFHAYLCSISKDSDEMSNFINIFIEEHGQQPAFDLFESCEQVVKRDDIEIESASRLKELSQICSSRFNKRWSGSVGGPIAIDYINQMLEARKVKTYPYSAEMDPYLVGR
ncbi:unnamed protein product [Adineta steineri]|uniref:Uncharacterized protein n=3 Tax=Adineta steineri TaxID=433720 RepID=A0A815CUV8_9BILA|nr:unnamed protein product [Adineta steineri]CAF1289329.1 unnamed protein product [Adineta steineri]